jgi:hypothetical protein
VLHGNFDHGAEIRVAFGADAGVAGIDAVLGQIARALGILGEQNVPVVVEVTDDGDAHALFVEFLDDARDCRGRLFVVDRDTNQFRAGTGQRGALLRGGRDVGGIGIGHRLHHNRCIRADAHTSDNGRNGLSALNQSHIGMISLSRGKDGLRLSPLIPGSYGLRNRAELPAPPCTHGTRIAVPIDRSLTTSASPKIGRPSVTSELNPSPYFVRNGGSQ